MPRNLGVSIVTDDTLGARVRRKRRENSLTQEELAGISGVSLEMISKIEQGRRQPRMPVLFKLAKALDVSLSELIDNKPRLDSRDEGASVLAIRDALLSPSVIAGIDLDGDHADPAPVPQIRAALDEASNYYWSGDFAKLSAALPSLLAEARLAVETAGEQASGLLAQAYDLAAALMVHLGKEDLAAIAAERAITAATGSGDELLHAMQLGSYAWILLHHGRLYESEQIAATTAERIEPAFSASDQHMAVFGSLLMQAMASAAAAGRDVSQYVALASAAAARIGRSVKVYQSSFGPATVHMQDCHAQAVTRNPSKALAAARKIMPGDITGISYGRHLLDVAQAHVDARHPKAAVTVLTQAHAVSPTWFRHQGIARSLIDDLYERETRISHSLRSLGASIDRNWYAPYHRP
jgi:transcriptional regulator with XRE-family HTH domain